MRLKKIGGGGGGVEGGGGGRGWQIQCVYMYIEDLRNAVCLYAHTNLFLDQATLLRRLKTELLALLPNLNQTLPHTHTSFLSFSIALPVTSYVYNIIIVMYS